MEDRRRFVRLDTEAKTSYTVLDSGRRVASTARNTSGGGACFFTDSRLSPGTMVQVVIAFPRRTVTFTAEVVWSGPVVVKEPNCPVLPFQTGVRFLAITPQDLAFITQLAQGTPAR